MIPHSFITQRMQNYFDHTDTRAREIPYTIEAQLLNMAAFELEDAILRINREVDQSLTTVPTNIDNLGVYYTTPLPPGFVTSSTQQTLTSVVGNNGSTHTVLTQYIDTLPVPTR